RVEAPQVIAAVLGEALLVLGGPIDEIEPMLDRTRLLGARVARPRPQRCGGLLARPCPRGRKQRRRKQHGATRQIHRQSSPLPSEWFFGKPGGQGVGKGEPKARGPSPLMAARPRVSPPLARLGKIARVDCANGQRRSGDFAPPTAFKY